MEVKYMSINRDSPMDAARRERSTVKVSIWANVNVRKWRCKICQEQTRLKVQDVNGKKTGWCNTCGTTFDISETTDVTTGDKKYVAKYGTASGQSHSFILSQKRKKRGELDQETADDLALFGFGTNDVRVTDARDFTYDSQGGRH